jgi:hypothetical protein
MLAIASPEKEKVAKHAKLNPSTTHNYYGKEQERNNPCDFTFQSSFLASGSSAKTKSEPLCSEMIF